MFTKSIMKYLKLPEQSSGLGVLGTRMETSFPLFETEQDSSENEYYQEVDLSDDIWRQNNLKFDISEISKIYGAIIQNPDMDAFKIIRQQNNSWKIEIDFFGIIPDKMFSAAGQYQRGEYSITLRKYKDEWYTCYLHKNTRRYKCDQLEGLLKCLEDIL